MTGRFDHFDPRPGGSYRLVVTYDDDRARPGRTTASSDVVEARFVAIVPGVRVVHAVEFVSDDPAYSGTMTIRWVGGGTRVEIRVENVPAGISAADHATGLASSLANLATNVSL